MCENFAGVKTQKSDRDESQTLLIPSLTPATSICIATTNQKWESTHAELIKRDYEIQGIAKKK
ncbi:11460_t:CDS:2 [Entrophospora sp. SA101]|nr:11460_t:CDS:2 [Entrophospora sp. SA101]CAJ0847003.1 15982_t:CDS:2 [Entrophospora sp. SA101]